MSDPRFGAYPEDWDTLSLIYGLGADLLPVVSNPGAIISPYSTLKKLGKTPSQYNSNRQGAGLKLWTGHYASDADITQWRKEPDYGICLQTRNVRALDIDISDATLSEGVSRSCGRGFLPRRRRENSAKHLFFFRLVGEHAKRVLHVEGGIIEFLANGQQFVIAGTHESGCRYEIENGWPDEIPTLTLEEFEALWATLVETFGIAKPSGGVLYRQRKPLVDGENTPAVHDEFLERLDIIGWGNEGQAFIVCPFNKEHTQESSESATAYFPKGTRGYQQGHFKCLHGHCIDRTDSDFITALDLYNDFEVIPATTSRVAVGGAPPRKGRPKGLKLSGKGEILPLMENLDLYLSYPSVCGDVIKFDTFCCDVMWYPWGVPSEENQWRRFDDDDYTRLQIRLGRDGFQSIPLERIRAAIRHVARRENFDSATVWIDGLAWDGVPRLETFLPEYFGSYDSAYSRAVSLYMWTAMAGRVIQPGVQADMVPIFIGKKQGERKTSGIRELVVSPEHFETVSLTERDADLTRKMLGKLVLEIGELRGFHSRDIESLKDFITRRHDTWVPKFIEKSTSAPRRSIFIGSTNNMEFLADTTGNRRFLPIETFALNVEKLQRDRAQLWAEGAKLFRECGVVWDRAENLATLEHGKHRVSDTWQEYLESWVRATNSFSGKIPAEHGFTLGEALIEALGLERSRITRTHEYRAAAILREMGFDRVQNRVDGVKSWRWCLPLC